jgi:hypothetical protein
MVLMSASTHYRFPRRLSAASTLTGLKEASSLTTLIKFGPTVATSPFAVNSTDCQEILEGTLEQVELGSFDTRMVCFDVKA